MAARNPYAPSSASLKVGDSLAAGDGIWRDDKRIIVAHGCSFPNRCVKCNEPSIEPHKMRKVYWHHPALYLLFFLYAIIYVIVALIVRKKAEINPGLCEKHLSRRRMWIAIGWIGSFAVLFAIPMSADVLGFDTGSAMIVGMLCFFLIVIVSIVNARILYPRRIDERYARLQGADERFLASLPDFVSY